MCKEGKIRGIRLSEASANTIRKTHAVHPISAVQIELSLFTPDPLYHGIADACHERTLSSSKRSRKSKNPSTDSVIHTTLRIPIAAYSPVNRSWLTG
jgi:pyridoxine 4-dehydrogenase